MYCKLGERGHPHDDGKHNFFLDSKSSILGLSEVISLVSDFLWKGGEIQQNVFPLQ